MLLASVNLLRTKPRLRGREQPTPSSRSAPAAAPARLRRGAARRRRRLRRRGALEPRPAPPLRSPRRARRSRRSARARSPPTVSRRLHPPGPRQPEQGRRAEHFAFKLTQERRAGRGAEVTLTFAMLDMQMANPGVPARPRPRPGVYSHAARRSSWSATGGSLHVTPKSGQPFTALVVDHASRMRTCSRPHRGGPRASARAPPRSDRRPAHEERARMSRRPARRAACAALLLVLLAAVPAALADGDPASDFLLSRSPVPVALRRQDPGRGAGQAERDARERAAAGPAAEAGVDRHPLRPRRGADPLQQAAAATPGSSGSKDYYYWQDELIVVMPKGYGIYKSKDLPARRQGGDQAAPAPATKSGPDLAAAAEKALTAAPPRAASRSRPAPASSSGGGSSAWTERAGIRGVRRPLRDRLRRLVCAAPPIA